MREAVSWGVFTEADDVVVARATMHDVPRPRVVLDPPDDPLRAALDLTDALLARYGAPRELMPSAWGSGDTAGGGWRTWSGG